MCVVDSVSAETTRARDSCWGAMGPKSGQRQGARLAGCVADGQTYAHTSKQVGLSERHLRKWAKRFIELGVRGLYDTKRPGRPPVFSPSGGAVFGQVSL
jgi:transposase